MSTPTPTRPNVLLLSCDDLNLDSMNFHGGPLPDLTPNLDRLAREGLAFKHAHTAEAVCQPSRQMMMTGRYPHHYGALGFHTFVEGTPNLSHALHAAGYRTGILGKVPHYGNPAFHHWDMQHDMPELGQGRDPETYRGFARDFFAQSKTAAQPFFLVANSHDPHRPFADSDQEKKTFAERNFPQPEKIDPAAVPLPPFLDDLPDVRTELAQYFASVKRLDDTVGALLAELDAAGLRDETIVMFFSDHGMALPFAKTNCYRAGTNSPWMIRWPGRIAPGRVDDTHFVSSVDFAPTLLEALDLPQLPGTDGQSFLPLLDGDTQDGREGVFTFFNQTAGRRDYPMRAWQDRRYLYVWNGWADGETQFKNESQAGLTMNAMSAASENDPQVAARTKHFLFRTPEEFYDYEADPGARVNLIDDPAHAERIARMKAALRAKLEAIDDPQASAFAAVVRA